MGWGYQRFIAAGHVVVERAGGPVGRFRTAPDVAVWARLREGGVVKTAVERMWHIKDVKTRFWP